MSDLIEQPQMLKTEIKDDKLIITVHRDYLVNSAECALTTGGEKTVIDKLACLRHYAAMIEDNADDSAFNTCIDRIANDAVDYVDWLNLDSK